MAYGRLCLSVSRDILYEIINIESPHEIWTTLKGLYGDENDLEERHLEAKRSTYYSSHESGEDSKNVEKYSQDSVEQEDFASSIVNGPVADENFILSNNEDIAHKEIYSSANDEDTIFKIIEEDFDSSTIDIDLTWSQFNDAPHSLSVAEPCMPMHASKEAFIAQCMHMYASTKAS